MGALDPAHVTYCPSLQPRSSVLGAEGGWGLAGLLFFLRWSISFLFLMWTIFKVFIEFVTILFLVFMCVCCCFFFCEPYGILASRPGIELILPALEGKVLTTRWPGKPRSISFSFKL